MFFFRPDRYFFIAWLGFFKQAVGIYSLGGSFFCACCLASPLWHFSCYGRALVAKASLLLVSLWALPCGAVPFLGLALCSLQAGVLFLLSGARLFIGSLVFFRVAVGLLTGRLVLLLAWRIFATVACFLSQLVASSR